MSFHLEQLIGRQRRAECAANDAALAEHRGELRPFLVKIGPRGAPRLEFAAMARGSVECFIQHVDLCEVGERCEILAAGAVS